MRWEELDPTAKNSMTVTAASGAVVSQIPRVWTKPNPPLGLYPGLYLNFTCPLIMGLHWTKDLNADVCRVPSKHKHGSVPVEAVPVFALGARTGASAERPSPPPSSVRGSLSAREMEILVLHNVGSD